MTENFKNKIEKARKDTETNLTDKQKESGNYKKGHINVNGFKISLENPKGSYRSGKDKNGKEWKTKMKNDYGYFLNTKGYDGDHIDCFLGSAIESKKIFVIDQKIEGKFDESKVMLWFNDKESAKNAYLSNYEKNWKGFDEITEVDEAFFKKWLYDGKKQRKPFHEYYEVKKKIKTMKINENTLRNLIKESVKKIAIKEGRESTKLTNALIKKLFNIAQNYKHIYHDDDWSNVHAMMDDMSQLDGIEDFNVGGGRYHNFGSGNGDTFKRYIIDIFTTFGTKINGIVNCHLCGTMENPYSAYDISVNFYRADNETLMGESINNANSIYTIDNWKKDGSLKPVIGQYVSDDVIEELLNSVPPTTYSRGIFQPGEAYTMSEDYTDLYMTFARKNSGWQYIGLCPKGSTRQVPEMRYESINNEPINEGKRGLNSPKLFQIAKEHGGLKPKHSMYTLRFNEFTDNDVIGVIEGDELGSFKNTSWNQKKEWAEKKGYTVNRGDEVVFIPMSDWTWVAVIERGSLLSDKEWKETPYGQKRIERGLNRVSDGKKNYVWTDTDLEGKHSPKGWSKRAFQFSQKKSDNDLKNSLKK